MNPAASPTSPSTPAARPPWYRRLDVWLPLGITVVAALVLLGTLPAQGLTDDDDFYAPAGIRYSAWLLELFSNPAHALTRQAIDKAFTLNHEHPPIGKYAIGLGYTVFYRWLGALGQLDAARAGVALLSALLAGLLSRLALRPFGVFAAIAAPVMLLSLPRFFFHSQVATLDLAVAAMVTATVAAYHWGETHRGRRWASGVVFGLALGTKLNAPFAAIGCVLFVLLTRWPGFGFTLRRSAESAGPPGLQLPRLPGQLFAMALIGPVVFLGTWPWMWAQTGKRMGEYIAFHLHHYPILLFFQGTIHNETFAPWTMPFIMAAGVIPLGILAAGAVGIGRALIATLVRAAEADADGQNAAADRAGSLRVLLLLQAFIAIGAVAFSNVPKYGGAKLFLPFFPLFCLLAADGLSGLFTALRTLVPSLQARGPAAAGMAALLLAACIPGMAGTAQHHGGYALSYYSGALGGLPGATAAGYERTYYDIADKPLATWLSANIPARDAVHFEPNHKEYVRTYRWLKKDGAIRRGLRLTNSKNAPYIVLTHERRWPTYTGLLETYSDTSAYEVVHEKRLHGVPLYTVYKKR